MTTKIGTGPQDIPLNQFLGEMAFRDAKPNIGCRVSLSTNGNHTLSNNDYFPWTNVLWQQGVEFDTTNYQFTAPRPGIYFISANIYKNGSGTPSTWQVVKNTSTVILTSRNNNGADTTIVGSIVDYLDVGDTLRVQCASAGFIAFENTNDGRYSNFNIYYLG
jgi:hypothetical protein